MKSGVVIREEFPFLGREDCPDELKVLVADMITAHDRYIKGHAKLFEVAHKGENACFNAAEQTVENYLENRLIWQELEHYKKTGKLLGTHPIFAKRNKEAELMKLSERTLKVRKANILRQIKYRNDMIADDGGEVDVYQRKEEIRMLKDELRFVTNRIEDYGKRKKRI